MRHLMSTTLVAFSLIVAFPASAAAATPESFIQLDDDTLRVTAGRAVRMTLKTPEREAWAVANIGQLQVRTFGKVETIVLPENRDAVALTYTFAEAGYAMLILAAGPSATRGATDSVQRTPYCAKLLVRVDADPSADEAVVTPLKSPGFTAKAGMKVEVSPFIDPTSMTPDAIRAGADLPVRVYFEGSAQKHTAVAAYGPDGTQQRRTTDGVGIAHFSIDQPGRWLVRYRHVADGVTFTGDLIFEVGATPQGGKE